MVRKECNPECIDEKNELRKLVQRSLIQILDLNKECYDLQQKVKELSACKDSQKINDTCWGRHKKTEYGIEFIYQCIGKPTHHFKGDILPAEGVDICDLHSSQWIEAGVPVVGEKITTKE